MLDYTGKVTAAGRPDRRTTLGKASYAAETSTNKPPSPKISGYSGRVTAAGKPDMRTT